MLTVFPVIVIALYPSTMQVYLTAYYVRITMNVVKLLYHLLKCSQLLINF